MAMLRDRDYDSMADYLLERANAVRRVEPPIDLFDLAKLQRVTVVDLRPMIPIGGLSCRTSGFVVYLRDLTRKGPLEVPVGASLEDRPRLNTRQRFTLAHELAHTLLFSPSDPPELRRDAPTAAKLESLCHRAARRLLLPPTLVAREMKRRVNLESADILDLARIFDVSPEVVLWRCDEIESVRKSSRAVVLIRRRPSGDQEITQFYCSQWFQDRKGRPEVGMAPKAWLASSVDESFWIGPEATSTVADDEGKIVTRRVPWRPGAYFVELRLERPAEDIPLLTEQDEATGA